MDKPNKIKNTRVVTFKEDYPDMTGKKGNPIARKGQVMALHVNLAAQLKDKGAKIDIKEFDYEGAVSRARVQLEKNRKKEAEMSLRS